MHALTGDWTHDLGMSQLKELRKNLDKELNEIGKIYQQHNKIGEEREIIKEGQTNSEAENTIEEFTRGGYEQVEEKNQ